jgi:hypothetical protein
MLLQQCSPHNQSQFTIVGYFHGSKQAAHLSAKKTRPLFVEYANLLLCWEINGGVGFHWR